MTGTRMVPADLIDYVLMQLARRRRRHLGAVGSEEFYEDFFSDLEVAVLSESADRRKNVRLESVRNAVRRHAPAGAKLLDVGCGVGDNLRSLVALGDLELHGVEYARSNVERARKALDGRATIVQGSAFELPYDSGTFDAVTCIEVLEHLSDDGKALDEIHRVLKPDAVLVLTVPHRHWFPAYRTLIGHERHYDRVGLTQLLQRHDLAVEEHLPNFPRWLRAADYAYVTCRIAGIIASRVGGDPRPQKVRLPGMKRPLLALLNDALEPLYQADNRLDYASLDAATSVVARRRATPAATA